MDPALLRQTSFIVFLDLSGLLQTIEVSHLWHEQYADSSPLFF